MFCNNYKPKLFKKNYIYINVGTILFEKKFWKIRFSIKNAKINLKIFKKEIKKQ